MRGDLTVRISDGVTDRHVTRHASGLKFRKTAPGGHADASCQLNVPRHMFSDLGPADRLWIYDSRTGRTVWEGYTNNPGTQSGRDGEGYDLSALGGQSRLSDAAHRLVYIDKTLTSWVQDTDAAQAPSGTATVSDGPDGSGALEGLPGLFLQYSPGHPVDSTKSLGLMYVGLDGSDMTVGGLIGQYDGGYNAGGDFLVYWVTPLPVSTYFYDDLSTALKPLELYAGGPYLDAGKSRVIARFRRTAPPTNVAAGNDTVWYFAGNMTVLGQLSDRYGTDLVMSSAAHVTVPNAYILASEVVEDLLGRVLTWCEPLTALVEPSTFPIDQLAYAEGVKAGQVLDDLTDIEPDMLYEVLESNPAGLHRFNWRAWPTTARYQIPASIPVAQPGSDMDLCNRILVTWSDAKGQPQVTVVTSSVPELGGRVRDADPITLPEGRGSESNAITIGQQILAAKASAPAAATVTVDRPIQDRLRGQWVQPWEIEPGYIVRLAGTSQNLRLTEMEYDDGSCTASLTLGTPVLTTEQRIARLDRVAS